MPKKKQPTPSKQPVSPTTVWLAVIASMFVALILYFGLMWLDLQTSSEVTEVSYTQRELGSNELLFFCIAVSLLILGPGILVALIVLPIIRKNKKK